MLCYKVVDSELIQLIHSSGIDGYVHTDGEFYLNGSDFKRFLDSGCDTDGSVPFGVYVTLML